MAKNINRQSTTIASSATKSDSIAMDLQRTPLAIITPAAMTGSSLSFEGSTDANGTDYSPIYNEGTLYSVTISTSASRYIALDPNVFHTVKRLKIVSGSTEGSARTIIVVSGEVQ